VRPITDDNVVCPSDTLLDAMHKIDRNTLGIVFVAREDGALVGSLSDGDIRRALIADASVRDHVDAYMNRTPRAIDHDATPEELEAFFSGGHIRVVPVTDDTRALVGLETMRDWLDEVEESSQPEAVLPAVIMAGGLGSRLMPLTANTPKPLLPVGGKPILERTIEHLRSRGVGQVTITTRYLAEQIEAHFEDGDAWDVEIDYIREKDRLGTAGGLKALEGRVDQPFLVMNGDLLTEINVEDMFAFHQDQGASLTVAVRHYAVNVPYGVVEVSGVRVDRLVEKPDIDLFVNAGIYILDPSVLALIPAGEFFDLPQLIDEVLARGELVASFPLVESWIDIGRPEDLEAANKLFDE